MMGETAKMGCAALRASYGLFLQTSGSQTRLSREFDKNWLRLRQERHRFGLAAGALLRGANDYALGRVIVDVSPVSRLVDL